MRHLRWQALIAVLGMVLIGSLLVGQGQEVIPEDVPAKGGVYIEALIGMPRALNPLLDYANPVDRDIDRLIFSGLTRFDESGRPAPDLANWFISADQLTYTFVLKPNLKWHDGAPLTTEDVAFTVGLLRDPAYPGPADMNRLWQSIQVTISNTQVIAFTLPEPFAPFLDYAAFGLLPQHLLSDVEAGDLPDLDFNLRPIGSGPFGFSSWKVESNRPTGVVLAPAADNYRPPWFNEVQFNFYPDAAAALAAYQDGEVHGVGRLDEAQVRTALRLPQLGLYTSVLPEYALIYLNHNEPTLPFFKEKRVRQALLAGLNRRAMVADILSGQAVVANSPIVPGSWAYHPNLPIVEYNPQAAISLLESAGWVFPEGALPGTDTYVRQKDGVPFAFTLVTPDNPVHVALAEAARQTWASLGVRVEVTPVDPARLRSEFLEARAFQAALVDFNLTGTPDPDPYPFWHETQAESGQNYGGFKDRLTSEYLEQARITADITARARLYQSFQSRFADQVPALLLYYPVYNYAVDTKVNGVQIGPLTQPSDRFNTLAQWYLITRRVIVENPLQGVEPPGGVATSAP